MYFEDINLKKKEGSLCKRGSLLENEMQYLFFF